MILENGKILVNTKIQELENLVKNELKKSKNEYFVKQVLPKILGALSVIVGEYFILIEDLSTEEKIMYQIALLLYSALISIVNTICHSGYRYYSKNNQDLKRLKRIKEYLDNNINILADIKEIDFEWYLKHINNNLQLKAKLK